MIHPGDRSAERVVVMGGGFAGLAAADALARRGVPVTLLERKPHLGGRAYSFVDRKTGDEVDNGQHLLMGCYTETLDFLRQIGAADKLHIQEDLRIDFLDQDRRRSALACPPLPAPFHVLLGILRMRSLSIGDRLSSLLLGAGLARAAWDPWSIRKQTAEEFLRRSGQSEGMRRKLWDIVTIATLNTPPRTASAKLLVAVIREALLASRRASRLVISKVGLSSLYCDDARRSIEERGGEVRLDEPVAALRFDTKRVTGVRLAGGEELPVRGVVSAVPLPALLKVLPEDAVMNLTEIGMWGVPDGSPILSVNIWFDRPIVREPLLGLQGTETQWIFNKDRIHDRAGRPGQYLSFVVSDASAWVELPKKEIISRILADLRRLLPGAADAEVIHSVIVHEREATILQTPREEALRLGHRTTYPNFVLAGDWTATGLPATIESAVRSGRRSVEHLLKGI